MSQARAALISFAAHDVFTSLRTQENEIYARVEAHIFLGLISCLFVNRIGIANAQCAYSKELISIRELCHSSLSNAMELLSTDSHCGFMTRRSLSLNHCDKFSGTEKTMTCLSPTPFDGRAFTAKKR